MPFCRDFLQDDIPESTSGSEGPERCCSIHDRLDRPVHAGRKPDIPQAPPAASCRPNLQGVRRIDSPEQSSQASDHGVPRSSASKPSERLTRWAGLDPNQRPWDVRSLVVDELRASPGLSLPVRRRLVVGTPPTSAVWRPTRGMPARRRPRRRLNQNRSRLWSGDGDAAFDESVQAGAYGITDQTDLG